MPETTGGGHRLYFSPDLDALAADAAFWRSDPRQEPPSTRQTKLFDALHHAIDHELTDKQRTAVRLFFFEGLSQGEIARQLGVSQQVVSKRLFGDARGGKMVGGAVAKLRKVLVRTLGL